MTPVLHFRLAPVVLKTRVTFVLLACAALVANAPLFAQPSGDTAPFTVSYTSPLGSQATLSTYLRAVRGPNPPKIGLVLSGGGARGISQIGVLRALEHAHVPIHMIVGTSIGAVVGGLYASGYTADELDSLARTTNWDELLVYGDERYRRELSYDQKLERDRSLLELQLDGLSPVVPDAISLGQRFTSFVNRLVWNAPYHAIPSFDDLKIPLRVVATDVLKGTRVVFDRGNLADVVRASATAPLRFTPLSKDSMILVDGGLMSNIPTDIARDAGCDIVIVVNATSALHDEHELTAPWDVADQVITIMMRQQYAAALRAADIVITPEIGDHSSSVFNEIPMLIAQGEAAASAAMPALVALIIDKRGGGHTAKNPRIHYHAGELASADADMLDHAAAANTPILRAFDSLVATGNYERVSMAVHDESASPVAEVTSSRNPAITRVRVLPVAHPAGIDSVAQRLVGSPYGPGTCIVVLEQMLRWYRTAGYSYGTITGTHFDAATGELEITVADGVIRSIDIRGNVHTHASVILREVPLVAGTPFLTKNGVRALSNLTTTNIFRQTGIEVIPSAGFVDVVIHVTEQNSQVLRITGRVDNERNAQLGAEIADDNLFGAGMHVGASIFGGVRNMTMQAAFSSNRILATYLSYNVVGYLDRRDIYTYADSQATTTRSEPVRRGEYAQEQNGVRVSVGENVPRLGMLGVTVRYEHQLQRQLNGIALAGSANVFAVRGQLVIDTQNDFPFPQSGTLVNAFYETGLRFFAANVAFTKLSIAYDGYVSVSQRLTLHPHAQWGYADETTPTADQFRLGGQQVFTGLFEDQYLGNQIFSAGLEYRYQLPVQLYFDTYLNARYDIGTVWPRIAEIQFGDLRHGAGAGISFATPLGAAEFSVGKTFTLAYPTGGRPLAVASPLIVYFSIGSRL